MPIEVPPTGCEPDIVTFLTCKNAEESGIGAAFHPPGPVSVRLGPVPMLTCQRGFRLPCGSNADPVCRLLVGRVYARQGFPGSGCGLSPSVPRSRDGFGDAGHRLTVRGEPSCAVPGPGCPDARRSARIRVQGAGARSDPWLAVTRARRGRDHRLLACHIVKTYSVSARPLVRMRVAERVRCLR